MAPDPPLVAKLAWLCVCRAPAIQVGQTWETVIEWLDEKRCTVVQLSRTVSRWSCSHVVQAPWLYMEVILCSSSTSAHTSLLISWHFSFSQLWHSVVWENCQARLKNTSKSYYFWKYTLWFARYLDECGQVISFGILERYISLNLHENPKNRSTTYNPYITYNHNPVALG